MLSPLQLDSFTLNRLLLETRPPQGEAAGITYELNFDVFHDHGETQVVFRIPLHFSMERKGKGPARLEVDVEGIFTVNDGTPKEEWEKLIPANPVAMLHSLIRGLVMDYSAHIPGGPIYVPVLNIMEIVKEIGRKKLAEAQRKVAEVQVKQPKERKSVEQAGAKPAQKVALPRAPRGRSKER